MGFAGLGASLALALLALANGDAVGAGEDTTWWRVWIASAGVLLFAFPMTMLALWRNSDQIAVVDSQGEQVLDRHGRPRTRRKDRPGSHGLFVALAMQAAALLLLVGTLLGLLLAD